MAKITFDTVGQYIAAGAVMGTDLYALEGAVRETEKAVAFNAIGGNSAGYAAKKTAWLPKSQIKKVCNDFYTDGPSEMWLVPAWLIRAKNQEGLDILAYGL